MEKVKLLYSEDDLGRRPWVSASANLTTFFLAGNAASRSAFDDPESLPRLRASPGQHPRVFEVSLPSPKH